MHARDLVEVAVMVVTRAETFFTEVAHLSDPANLWSRYWTVSRCRLDRWQRKLPLNAELQALPSRSAAEEILTSEILTRVWTALLCFPQHGDLSEREPIARNIYLAHQEARNRVLKLLTHPELLSTSDAIALNRLRRRCERWTDLLLAYLSQHGEVEEFAFDTDRMHDFAEDLRDDGVFDNQGESWLLLLASLRSAFQQGYTSSPRNADLNKQLATLIMKCLPAKSIEHSGFSEELCHLRIEHMTSQTESLIAELFQLDNLVQSSAAPLRRGDD